MTQLKWTLAFVFAATAFGADYEGSDVRTATQIEFGQIVMDNLDATLRPRLTYSVSLARGQRFTVTAKMAGTGRFSIAIYNPALTTIANGPGYLAASGWIYSTGALEYAVPAAGKYYVVLWSGGGAAETEVIVSAVGARLDVPLPASASCLEGNVDEIQFNLQQVSLNLAEEVVIGGVKICAACNVKPTLFPAFVDFLRQAHFAGTRVQVCHASDGQIVRVKSAR